MANNGVGGGTNDDVQDIIDATLEFIENQGYLKLSSRWTIGDVDSSNNLQTFFIWDTLSPDDINGNQNVYAFLKG